MRVSDILKNFPIPIQEAVKNEEIVRVPGLKGKIAFVTPLMEKIYRKRTGHDLPGKICAIDLRYGSIVEFRDNRFVGVEEGIETILIWEQKTGKKLVF